MISDTNILFEPADIEQFDWANRVLLITEDEEVNYFYLKTLLKRTSARIIRAKNGQEAVDIITTSQDHVDLILMDINMPVMDGYEALKQIKSLHPDIPIIAQTAYTLTDDRHKCLKAGFTDYIAKPINRIALLRLVDAILTN